MAEYGKCNLEFNGVFRLPFLAILGQKASTEYPRRRSLMDAFPAECASAFLTPNLCRMYVSLN